MKISRLLVLLLVFWVLEGAGEKYQSYTVEGGGTISGRVIFSGKPSKRKEIVFTQDKAVCGAHGNIYSEELVVDSSSKGVKNVVVSITDISRGMSTSSMPVPVLDQKGCVFRPHILIVPVGQTIKISNSDGILHNIHTQSVKNPPVNLAQPGGVKEIALNPFKVPELVKVNCNVHGWMEAWLWVTEHPYVAITKDDGSYEISDIPPGKYRLEFWHEALGKLSQEVTVLREKDTRLDMVYPAK